MFGNRASRNTNNNDQNKYLLNRQGAPGGQVDEPPRGFLSQTDIHIETSTGIEQERKCQVLAQGVVTLFLGDTNQNTMPLREP